MMSLSTGNLKKLLPKIALAVLVLLMPTVELRADAQGGEKELTGVVTDDTGEAIPGATVVVKGTTIGTITDLDGGFTLKVPQNAQTLLFSFMGLTSQEVAIGGKTKFNITLASGAIDVEEVVVVGYGVQKKESVVGAITQATGEDLLKAGGVTNVGEALQGRLPGVTTMYASGMPGESDPQIYIRGQSSWNGSGQPLILVDGVERSMSDIDMNDIDQISVLKDASATAVFGVKGGNGVILITTKRGSDGKAQLSLSANTTIKMISQLPEKLDAYDAIMVANEAIMREVMYSPGSWDDYRPIEIADKYRNPLTEEESWKYPNVDWKEETVKDFATDFRVNLSVRGGTDFAKYFGSLSYQQVRDILNGEKYDSGKSYFGEYRYDRFNYRTNIDFDITPTTKFSVNLSGFLGVQEKPVDAVVTVLNGLYMMAPNLYMPVYPDGLYGKYYNDIYAWKNPIVNLISSGYKTYTKFQVNSDFMLDQKLDFITKGLSFKGKLSLDNDMTSLQQLRDAGADDMANVVYRYYDEKGNEIIDSPSGVNDFDFVVQPWTLDKPEVDDNTRVRRLNYEFSLNYNNVFADVHNVTALFLMKREEYAKSNMFPRFREDWVGRLTYNYDSRYFFDVNGAYNGSEKFGVGYRFGFFPSAALGWMVTNENFMEDLRWFDKLKIRGSYGLVGDDNFSGRWKYMTQWGSGGSAYLVPGNYQGKSPYTFYKEASVGNPDLHWETALKSNIGVEVALWRNKLTADFDYFIEDRDNIYLSGSQRSIPDFYGTAPPDYNSGKTQVKGYELVLGANHTFDNGVNLWGKYSITNAKDKVIFKEDPALRPFYQKAAGYPIGQQRSAIPTEIMQNWDDIYMSTPKMSGQEYVRVGYYDLVDFDGNGVYDSSYDNAPWGYPIRPQKTWTLTTGAGYKGFSVMVQFYGTQNSLRTYSSQDFKDQTDLFYAYSLGYWSKDNPDATKTLKQWSQSAGATDPRRNSFDSSILRLKTLELAYNVPKKFCERLGVSSLKVFANGNNLYLWSDLPDDREFNATDDSRVRGDYPTMKRFNFGLNLNF